MNIINNSSQKEIGQRLRSNMPKPEQVLWYFLRKRQIGGIKFRRQVSIGSYIVDFCSLEKKIIIEVDGDSHASSDLAVENDKKRTGFLEKQGFFILRFTNKEIMKNSAECVNRILEYLGVNFVTPLLSPLKGEKFKAQAFTLIELVVTMSLIGILFAASAPSFGEFQTSSRLKSSTQTLETVFGEAFSSARSRPEYFIIKGAGENLSLKSCADSACENELNSRNFQLNSGVKFTDSFEVTLKPPFGDILPTDETDSLKIEICNDDCVKYKLHYESGLFARDINPKNND